MNQGDPFRQGPPRISPERRALNSQNIWLGIALAAIMSVNSILWIFFRSDPRHPEEAFTFLGIFFGSALGATILGAAIAAIPSPKYTYNQRYLRAFLIAMLLIHFAYTAWIMLQDGSAFLIESFD